MKNYIPNTLTIFNLVAGCFAIASLHQQDFVSASWFIIIALILDFLDGFTARMLQVQSNIGKQLDSLADLVTFGVAPSFILYFYLTNYVENMDLPEMAVSFLPYLAFLLPASSAIRLAKFNIDSSQVKSFIGVPTPATAIFILSIPLIFHYQGDAIYVIRVFDNIYFFLVVLFLFSYLQISPLHMLSLKFTDFSWSNNKSRYLLIFFAVLLILSVKFVALPLIIIIYLLLSFISGRMD